MVEVTTHAFGESIHDSKEAAVPSSSTLEACKFDLTEAPFHYGDLLLSIGDERAPEEVAADRRGGRSVA